MGLGRLVHVIVPERWLTPREAVFRYPALAAERRKKTKERWKQKLVDI